jgi:hypothetical protein
MKESFYEKLKFAFDKYLLKILLEGFNAKVGREKHTIATIWNDSLYKIINENGISLFIYL